jgi:hypothetical protein
MGSGPVMNANVSVDPVTYSNPTASNNGQYYRPGPTLLPNQALPPSHNVSVHFNSGPNINPPRPNVNTHNMNRLPYPHPYCPPATANYGSYTFTPNNAIAPENGGGGAGGRRNAMSGLSNSWHYW